MIKINLCQVPFLNFLLTHFQLPSKATLPKKSKNSPGNTETKTHQSAKFWRENHLQGQHRATFHNKKRIRTKVRLPSQVKPQFVHQFNKKQSPNRHRNNT
jgi:hypothetical protein